ncbi:MAG TPA: hypothetical protein VGN95_03055 [Pyrinomonadaceae bacterium]|nr:hypothetical protein [Pyrinomonadaceae bacterium]
MSDDFRQVKTNLSHDGNAPIELSTFSSARNEKERRIMLLIDLVCVKKIVADTILLPRLCFQHKIGEYESTTATNNNQADEKR